MPTVKPENDDPVTPVTPDPVTPVKPENNDPVCDPWTKEGC